ncbi:MAG: glycosyltransferase, partial [Acidimicrobiales bacterium]
MPSADVLVVDDNSPDGTGDRAEVAAAELGQVKVLRRPVKDGLGNAYRAGLTIGLDEGYDALVQIDADFSHDPAVLPSLLARLDAGADVVVGSRYVAGGSIPNWPPYRRALSRYGNRYAVAMLGLDVLDATAGYRAYRAELLRSIGVGDTRANGYGFLMELAHRGRQCGARSAEVRSLSPTGAGAPPRCRSGSCWSPWPSSPGGASLIGPGRWLAAGPMVAERICRPTTGPPRRHQLHQLTAGHRRWVLVAATLGLGLRVAWVQYASRPPLGLYDPARYASYADLIAEGLGYSQFTTRDPTAYYPPGYPFFLGAIEWLHRHTPLPDDISLVTGLIQAGLGALTVVLGAIVARRLAGRRAAVVTAFVLALYPNLVWHSGALLSETLYNALFMGFLAVLVGRPWREGLSPGRVAASALLFGATLMVRPISAAVLPALALAWWVDRHDIGVLVRRLAVFGAVVALFLVPWTVRNRVQMDAFVLMSTNTGDNLCIGHHPGADGDFAYAPACETGETGFDGKDAEIRHDRELTARARRFILDDPLAEPRLVAQKAYWMFRDDHDALVAVQSFTDDDFISARLEDPSALG